MISHYMRLTPNLAEAPLETLRSGFSRGLIKAGEENEQIVVVSADVGSSTQAAAFGKQFGRRYIEVGIAEQNMLGVASGLAHMGRVPFAVGYAAFSPGRNWEQIRTTVCLNNVPVKIVGTHAGLNVGQDGATHQALEDIALMRVLPRMTVIAPADSIEAEKATRMLARTDQPTYLRISREPSAVFTTEDTPFEIGKAYVLREGYDVALLGTGPMTYELLMAAQQLAERGISCEVVHVPTIKPMDSDVVAYSARKCGRVVTAEDGLIAGGFGSAVNELLVEAGIPMPLYRLGVNDTFGESGTAQELLSAHNLTAGKMTPIIADFVAHSHQYYRE